MVLRGGALGALAASAAGRARPQTSAQLSATSATNDTTATSATGATARTASLAARPARSLDFGQGWLFGGPYTTGAEQPGFDDSGFAAVTLPHTVTPLSWGDWDVSSWQNVWIYRKHFARPPGRGRVLADFDGVMTNATVVLNGTTVSTHQGGYLPWSAELTGALADGDNVLAVIVDATWLDVPPDGSPKGAAAVDYLQPGGIYRDVTLRVVPEVFLSDVFVLPSGVLGPSPSVAVQATIDAAVVPSGPLQVTAQLLDGSRPMASASATVTITGTGPTVASLTINGLGPVALWSPDAPRLYTVRTTLDGDRAGDAGGPDVAEVRTGFREADFRVDGFYLNGQRLEIFGLDRHQLFPYLGMAAAARLQRRDAEIIRNELNCNMVRCSHYPQSPHFLDACDELGLMVWEETPGWQYVGDAAFQDDRRAERARHGGPRPQPAVGHHLGHPAQRDGQLPRPLPADPPGRRPAGRIPAHLGRHEQLLAHRLGAGRVRLRRLPPHRRRRCHAEPAAARRAVPGHRGGRRAGRRAAVPLDRHRGGAGRAGPDACSGAQPGPGR